MGIDNENSSTLECSGVESVSSSIEFMGVQHQVMGQFLRGPIPMAWLEAACELGFNALRVGIAIWQVSGKKKRAVTVPLTTLDVQRLGVASRQAKWSALRKLEGAGLISTERVGHHAVRVTLLRWRSGRREHS